MQDIFLSTPPAGASASGLAVGGAIGSGGQTTSEGESFGATLTGVFHSVLTPEKLDEISTKLESLGVDTGFLESIDSLFNGNLMSLEEGQEGMALPQLSAFLTTSLAELEKLLSQNAHGSNELGQSPISEDLLNSLGDLINSIQKTVEPLKDQLANVYRMPEGANSVAVPATPTAPVQSTEASKSSPANSLKDSNGSVFNAYAAQASTGAKGQESLNQSISNGMAASSAGDQSPVLPSGERQASQVLDDQFSKLLNSESMSDVDPEALLDKVTVAAKDKTSITGLKATFTDAQARLESTPYSTTVMTGLDDLAWGEEVSQKIVWLTGKAIQSAEIHLNPAELGPIDVKISVQNDAAAVTFNAHNASVREMLESNVVRLREMMETNGVDLQEVNVDARQQGDERFASQDQQQGSDGGDEHSDETDASQEELLSSEESLSLSSNLVDYFA